MTRAISKPVLNRHTANYNTLYNQLTAKSTKLKPETSNFLLIISSKGNSIKCKNCGTKMELGEDYDHKADVKIIDKFKLSHKHQE